MSKNKSTALPQGYSFVYSDILPEEINTLREKFGWNSDTSERWRTCLSESIVAGVRHNHELIGVGFIAGNARHGVLCDLSIDPKHDGHNLGKAIINETLRLAKQKGMNYFYLHMSPPHQFREIYLDLGFQDTGGSLFRNDALKY